MGSALPSGTVTFLFTDIEGSTRLLHELGPEGYGEALAEHRRLLREAFAAHDGVEVDTQGDAFFVAFPTAAGAAAAAQAGHAALAAGPVRVRIGLHTGQPTVTGEGYVGVDVHRGARIAALAHGDQTLLSPTTAALLDGADLLDLGTHRLKDFDGATRLHQLGAGSHPPLRSPGTIALPTPATRFLGREHELHAAVSLLLEHDPRLLTILGPGGTGKTRFAIELARLLADHADGGTHFIPLAPLHEAALVLPAIAQVLGATEPTVAAIAAKAAARTHLLLDNAEHLLPEVAATIAELATGAPELRLLVTSREALRVQGEQELDLPPLVEEDAVELFVTRARAVRPEAEPTDAVRELCERLDRLPLALELAAARTKLLAPEALLDRLGQRLDLLKGGRDADPRHATLRATIAWSHDLLDPDEQTLFARLSVFAAGATLESAELVCDADPDTLESLLDKSLLRRRTGALGEDRYWMLETIREYAAEQLAATGDEEQLRRRHAERMLEIARAAHLSLETGIGEAPQRHDLVLAERHDVRRALDWAEAADPRLGLEIVLVLENFWVAADPGEGARRLAGLLERDGALPAELVPRVLRLQGNHAARSGDPQLGIRRYEESIAAYRELGDDRGAAVVLVRVAANVIGRGEVAQGRAMAEEALQLARRLGTAWVEAQALGVLGQADQAEGDLESAWERARHSVRIAEACGFRWWQAGELINVLELGLELGYLAEAEDAGREGLRLATAIEDRFRLLAALVGLARVELELGRLERAGRLWGAATDSLEREPIPGYAFGELEAPLIETTDPGFLAGTEAGRDGGLEAAVELAIRQR